MRGLPFSTWNFFSWCFAGQSRESPPLAQSALGMGHSRIAKMSASTHHPVSGHFERCGWFRQLSNSPSVWK